MAAAAIIASIALPPSRRISAPASPARWCGAVTMPPRHVPARSIYSTNHCGSQMPVMRHGRHSTASFKLNRLRIKDACNLVVALMASSCSGRSSQQKVPTWFGSQLGCRRPSDGDEPIRQDRTFAAFGLTEGLQAHTSECWRGWM